jgi:hypothetical protein
MVTRQDWECKRWSSSVDDVGTMQIDAPFYATRRVPLHSEIILRM